MLTDCQGRGMPGIKGHTFSSTLHVTASVTNQSQSERERVGGGGKRGKRKGWKETEENATLTSDYFPALGVFYLLLGFTVDYLVSVPVFLSPLHDSVLVSVNNTVVTTANKSLQSAVLLVAAVGWGNFELLFIFDDLQVFVFCIPVYFLSFTKCFHVVFWQCG